MLKKFFFIFIFVAFFLLGPLSALASDSLNAYFFYGDGCPHCAKEEIYLETAKTKYPELQVRGFEVYHNRDNQKLFQEVAKALNSSASGVPFLVIGDEVFIGFNENFSPKEIGKRIEECLNNICPDSVAPILGLDVQDPPIQNDPVQNSDKEEKIIQLPLLGEIDAQSFSLPLLTVVMGVLDGFNPCAMWALLFLISLLFGMQDRKKMWILGTTFIVASGAVYFIFMAAWLNLILFLGLVIWVRIMIGALALFGGGYNLKKFVSNPKNTCEVSEGDRQQKVLQKLKNAVYQKNFWLALAGIIALAFFVNLIELLCSAGLPAVYTQILALNELIGWQYYLYILLYILFFMLDDLLVFFIAMITLRATGVTTKYARYSRLVGGLLMLLIGLLLIFKPGWLMFG